ncbi:MAG TPA: hypothetical protein VF892_04950 [Pseudonocardiaceae bacterium]
MADQLPEMPQLPPVIAGLDPLAAIVQVAEEIAHEVSVMGGGQYAFQPDELRSVLAQWKELDHTVQSAMTPVRVRAATGPGALQPGNESASATASHAAHTTNQAYQAYLTSMHNYIQGYVTDLQGVLDRYTGTESANTSMATGQQGTLRA